MWLDETLARSWGSGEGCDPSPCQESPGNPVSHMGLTFPASVRRQFILRARKLVGAPMQDRKSALTHMQDAPNFLTWPAIFAISNSGRLLLLLFAGHATRRLVDGPFFGAMPWKRESRGVSAQNGQHSRSHNSFQAARCRLAVGPASDRRTEYEVQDKAWTAHSIGFSSAVPSILILFISPCSCAEPNPPVPLQVACCSLPALQAFSFSFQDLPVVWLPEQKIIELSFHRLSRQETIAIRQDVLRSSCMVGLYPMARPLSRIHRRTLGCRPGPIRLST